MMNWRSRPLALFLPIAFLFLPQPEGAWAQGRRHGYGHHHDHHHPSHHHFGGHHLWVAVACALELALLACPAWAWSGATAAGGMAGGALSRRKDEKRSADAGSTDGHVRLGDDPAGAVMALKQLCRGQRRERSADFLAA